ncbi:MAG: S8 family serine peptidase [Anaerolineae bacterium]
MNRTQSHTLIGLLILILVLMLTATVARAALAALPDQTPRAGSHPGELAPPAYAVGRIIVQLRPGSPSASASSLLSAYGAVLREQVAADTYTVSVPPGQEEELARRLQEEPSIASAMLDLKLVMPPLQPLQAVADESGSPRPLRSPAPLLTRARSSIDQTSRGVITETLHMSTAPAGPPLPENTLPTESPQVYAIFDYEGLGEEPVRLQVYAPGVETSPIVVFDTVEILSGSGTASVVVPAWEYFVDTGAFPIGHYITLLYESTGGSWRVIAQNAWHVSTQPNDLWFLADRYQWNLHNTGKWGTRDADIDAPEAWDVTTGSENVTIAIISSGVVMNHPDLKNKIWLNEDEIPGNGVDDDGNGYVDDGNGYEFFSEEDNPDPTDDIGWGTFAAGIAAAETNNEIGMAGVSWGARIMPIKVVRLLVTSNSRVPYGFVSDLIQGLHYAADNGAQVIFVAPVVSSDQFEKVEALRQAVEYATRKGSLVIGVVGDQGRDDAVWPALFPEVLGVGATDYNDELTDFSNFGEALNDGLVAPGKLILSTCMSYLPACVSTYPQDIYGQTAWAAAQVAGIASLVWSVNPQLSPDEVRQRLQETADDLGPPGADQLYGHGRLNAGRAVRWTRHLLHLDMPELYFLVDDLDTRVCRIIRNSTTGPFSWSASEDTDWLQINGPTGTFTPSHLEVCVICSELEDYGTYEATLTILSTLDTQTEPVSIPVTVKYIPHKSRIFLPLPAR